MWYLRASAPSVAAKTFLFQGPQGSGLQGPTELNNNRTSKCGIWPPSNSLAIHITANGLGTVSARATTFLEGCTLSEEDGRFELVEGKLRQTKCYGTQVKQLSCATGRMLQKDQLFKTAGASGSASAFDSRSWDARALRVLACCPSTSFRVRDLELAPSFLREEGLMAGSKERTKATVSWLRQAPGAA